ncbi:basic helix-loop-helix (bHLH) DNA-binding superfamily protein [Actinidia rufa]|uniref:Basic helix-loop-helix (BHLH) DNA-binding superfamily protein n=1 Tax=Actinidia rufa TaxID=165716 RepID=A0A7J0H125_9ERIC|nr:basic helix-loop-helix (bHLH) DNA-binding superfamily protein [Actinidia rufa]
MASGGVRDNLRKQLAVAVRSIQWSYAIFWSISSTQPGVLEWGDGYYNGDIKTRKTVQAEEFNANQIRLQRSEQLRELFESLLAGENSPQARRPSASLSPEDLTHTEWYYLVCMSFVFNIGQGLPGRTLAKGRPIWLCNAHCADSKSFSRSLLAKVMEEPGLIQHIKASFLEIPYQIVSKGNARNEKHCVGCEEVEVCSPHSSSNRIVLNDQQAEDRSQKRSWQFKVDDEVSNCVHDSMSSSAKTEKISAIPKKEKENDGCLLKLPEDNPMKLTSLGVQADEVHYLKVDQVSILENTIERLKELKRRVEKLESCREVIEVEEVIKRSKPRDTAERISDKYRDNTNKNHLMNKRKACEIDETEPEINQVRVKDSVTDNVSVSVVEKDVVIEIGCPWREFLLLEIMDSMRQLQLDSHSVQSTNTDGILNLTIKSKVQGSTVASSEITRQALQRVVQKCRRSDHFHTDK